MAVGPLEFSTARTPAAVVAAPDTGSPAFQDLLDERMVGAEAEETAQEQPAERENRAEEPEIAPDAGTPQPGRDTERVETRAGGAPQTGERVVDGGTSDPDRQQPEGPVDEAGTQKRFQTARPVDARPESAPRQVGQNPERPAAPVQIGAPTSTEQAPGVPVEVSAAGTAAAQLASRGEVKPAATPVGGREARRAGAKTSGTQAPAAQDAPATSEAPGEARVRDDGTAETPERQAPFSPTERFAKERREPVVRDDRGASRSERAPHDGPRDRATDPAVTRPVEPPPVAISTTAGATATPSEQGSSAEAPGASAPTGAARAVALSAASGPDTSAPAKGASEQSPLQFEKLAGDPFLEQVGRGLGAALRQRGGTVTMRLHPSSLGQLRVRMELDGGRVNVKFEASSEPARRLLEKHLHTLRSALEARGLRVEALEVHVPNGQEARDRQDAGDSARDRGTEDPHGGAGGNGEREAGSERPGDGKGFPGSDGGTPAEGARGVVGVSAGVPARGAYIEREGGGPTYRIRLDAVA